MSELRPSILDDMGLESAVEWYAEMTLQRNDLQATIDVRSAQGTLPANVEIAAFRVFQEAITNATKHANADQVWVTLCRVSDELKGTVRDDGRGFVIEEAKPGADGGWAVGLLGMSERVNLLGGSLSIDSNPGEGTVVQFNIPVNRVS